MSVQVSNLIATDGARELSLGPVALSATGAQLRQLIANKAGLRLEEVQITFLAAPVEDTETLLDMGFSPEGTDKIGFLVQRVGGVLKK